ncbi:hypothetical protein ANCDUO_07836 [Ancylostoma duodenale]|uniref:Uncharacterized protein n=1 Tax=Ancylostoma duodenale TaxID=51022 RepID=A0A0C2GSA1_9BILA|nr:hypothetical protein ANCDUO_07836 [Ancylostoma duodenale]
MDELDRCDISTLLHHLLLLLDALEQISRENNQMLRTLLKRTAPKSNSIFCPAQDNRDSHSSSKCPGYPNPVVKASQTTKLGPCLRCLEAVHEDDCVVKCGNFSLSHNFLLCDNRRLKVSAKRQKVWSFDAASPPLPSSRVVPLNAVQSSCLSIPPTSATKDCRQLISVLNIVLLFHV